MCSPLIDELFANLNEPLPPNALGCFPQEEAHYHPRVRNFSARSSLAEILREIDIEGVAIYIYIYIC